jgi:hypothetical protein
MKKRRAAVLSNLSRVTPNFYEAFSYQSSLEHTFFCLIKCLKIKMFNKKGVLPILILYCSK